MAPATPPAVKWVANPTVFFSDDIAVLWSYNERFARWAEGVVGVQETISAVQVEGDAPSFRM